MAASAAGEEKAPDEQADWLGQPAHAEAFPAPWEVGPTQPSLALEGTSPEDDDIIFVGVEILADEMERREEIGVMR